MVTVISHDLFSQGNINSIMEMNTTEYIHVSSRVRKLAVINLGMNCQELDILKNLNASLNIFNKQFNPKTLSSLDIDYCILTNGSLTKDEFEAISANIKPLMGKVKFIGIGAGKDILMSSTCQTDWTNSHNYLENKKYNLTCFDSTSEAFKSLTK